MRKTVYCTLLAALFLALPVAAQEAATMNVDQLIEKHMESRGGRAAWDAVETAKVTGTMSMGGGMEAPFTLFYKRPDKVRLEFVLQGMTAIQAYDGTTGWYVMPFTGNVDPQQMPEDQVKAFKEMADFEGPLVDYAEKGHQVELVGQEEIEGTPAYKIKITKEDGDVVYTYLDTDYFLEFKQQAKSEMGGVEVTSNITLGDYKEVGDPPILMAHSIEMMAEGAPAGQTITIQAAETGVDVADSLFTMPAAAPAEPPATGDGN